MTSSNDTISIKSEPRPQSSGSVTDEGYIEQRLELPDAMKDWTDDEKAEFTYQLLLSIPANKARHVLARIGPLLHHDYLSPLPRELAMTVMEYLDIKTILQLERVSRYWRDMAQDQALWRQYFLQRGWRYNIDAVHAYLENKLLSQQRHRLATIPIARTTAAKYDPKQLPTMPGAPMHRRRRPRFLPFRELAASASTSTSRRPLPLHLSSSNSSSSRNSSRSTDTSHSQHESDDADTDGSTSSNDAHGDDQDDIYSQSTMAQHVVERRLGANKNRPMDNDETAKYHYIEDDDKRFINWRRLYHNRSIIERRWQQGQYWLRSFPASYGQGESQGHTDWIYCLQFDTTTLISGSRDRTIKLWDMTSGECVRTLLGHSASVLCLQFNDQWIFSGSSDKTILVWDRHTGNIRQRLLGHTESVLNLCISKHRLVTASKDRTVRLWEDLQKDDAPITPTLVLRGHNAAINAVKCQDDIIVSASGDRTIRVWNAVDGQCLQVLTGHSRGIACVELVGNRIVSGSGDQGIVIWDVEQGKVIHTLAGHSDLVRTLQMDDQQKFIVSGGYDGTLRVWNAEQGHQLKCIQRGIDGRILNLQFDFTKIACGTNLCKIFLVDFAHGVDTRFLI